MGRFRVFHPRTPCNSWKKPTKPFSGTRGHTVSGVPEPPSWDAMSAALVALVAMVTVMPRGASRPFPPWLFDENLSVQ